MDAPLTLTATPAGDSFGLATSIPVRLTLTNRSAEPVLVNRRFGVGYPDGHCREVFCTIRDDTGRVLPISDATRVDVHRLLPARTDFESLGPRQAVTGELDLALWYPFDRPGTFSVEFHYENSDDGRAFGLVAFIGRIDSDRIQLRVTA